MYQISLSKNNFISDIFYLWVFKLIYYLKTKDTQEVKFTIGKQETAKKSGKKLLLAWKLEVEKNHNNPSIFNALMSAFGKSFSLLSIWKLLWIAFTWTGLYYIVKHNILYIQHYKEGKSENEYYGYIYAATLLISLVCATICNNQLYTQCTKIGIRVRSSLMVLIYRKTLTLSALTTEMGNVINLISNDCNRIAEACVNLHYIWSSILEAILICIIAFYEIKTSALPTIGIILFVFIPLQIYLSRKTSSLSYNATIIITNRVHLMSEILTVIKLIKFYAWERFFEDKVSEIRKKEVKMMQKLLFNKCITLIVVFVAPMISTMLSLILYYVIEDRAMSPTVTFTLLSLFNSLRYPLSMLPTATRSVGDAYISLRKLDNYFIQPETFNNCIENFEIPVEDENIDMDEINSQVSILMENAKFTYDNNTPLKLAPMNLIIRRGEKVAFVGEVTTCMNLLDALLGQLILESGIAFINGKVGYIPQQPWIIKGSLADNITFNNQFNEELYNKVLAATLLNYDISHMDSKDLLDISDSNINLSLNQKQRICIARCLYHQPDVVILDDPLVGFDTQVKNTLFKNCVKNFLNGKTIIMFTRGKQFLNQFDKIMVMDNGEIVECASYDQLKQMKNIQLQNNDILSWDDETTSEPSSDINYEKLNDTQLNPELTNELTVSRLSNLNSKEIKDLSEESISKVIENNHHTFLNGARPMSVYQDTIYRTIENNQMTMHTVNSVMGFNSVLVQDSENDIPVKLKYRKAYKSYISCSPGALLSIFTVTIFFMVHAIRFFSDYYLKWFIDRAYDNNYIFVYGILAIAMVLGVILRGLMFCWVMLKKSVAYHNGILKAVMNAPMLFFDNTPLGTILTAFAKHLFLVDEFLPDSILQFLYYCPLILGTVVIVSLFVPYFWTTLPVYIVLIWCIKKYSKSVEHRLQVQEAQTKTEIFSHITATLEGLRNIKIYKIHKNFETVYKHSIDLNHKSFMTLSSVQTWTSFYLDIVSALFVFFTALFIAIFKNVDYLSGKMTPAVAGLSITNSLAIVIYLPWLFRTIGDIHNAMASCSALKLYTQNVPCEEKDDKKFIDPPENWPSQGQIEFKNVVIRYWKYSVAVLKAVSFTIYPKETICVFGSSGSGKTTLMMSLLRMVEASKGSIYIDNLNIKHLHLNTLRSSIGIIPQEPVLFAGTIHSNLDPFNLHSDYEIWNALRMVSLYDDIQMMPQKLETSIIENGRNFSPLQCILFMIARVIVLNTNIVIYDESILPLDEVSEKKIEQIIHTAFKNKTLIIISNKIRHAIKVDRVMVMELGRIKEFDSPKSLYMNPNSYFSKLFEQNKDPEILEFKKYLQESDFETNESNKNTKLKDNIINGSLQIPPNIHKNFMGYYNVTMPKSLEDVFANPFNNNKKKEKIEKKKK